MTVQDCRRDAGERSGIHRGSLAGRDRWTRRRRVRAAVSSAVIASFLFIGLGAVAHARDLSRSEVEAISRSEARREFQRRNATGQNVPTDLMQVGPQGRPTTVNGNGTTVTRNR